MPSAIRKSSEKKLAISGFFIERTARRMKQAVQKKLTEENAGITADQWIILNLLAEESPLSQFEIAEKSYKDAPTVTRMLDLMGNKNLLERLPDPDDRRRFKIVLTPEGRKKYEETLPLIKEIRSVGYDNLSDQDLNDLLRIMQTIFSNFETDKKEDHALL